VGVDVRYLSNTFISLVLTFSGKSYIYLDKQKNVCMYVYVCMYVCIYVCMYVCIHVIEGTLSNRKFSLKLKKNETSNSQI